MTPKQTASTPPGFDKASFLSRLCRQIDHLRYKNGGMSAQARFFLALVSDALMCHRERLGEEVKSWTRELIMTALVDTEADALVRFRTRLEQERGWWRMVSLLWLASCTELAQGIEEELPKYLKAQPVCSAEQREELRIAIRQLTPSSLFGEAFVEWMDEPLMTMTFDEEAEVERFASALLDLVKTQWPPREDEADPWSPAPEDEQEGNQGGAIVKSFFGRGPRVWLDTSRPDAQLAEVTPPRLTPTRMAQTPPTRRRSRRACARPSIRGASWVSWFERRHAARFARISGRR